MLVIINVKHDCSSAMQYIDNLYLSRLLEKSGNFMWSGKWPPWLLWLPLSRIRVQVMGHVGAESI